MSNCCKKCADYDNDGGRSCAHPDCKCHTPTPPESTEAWIIEFREYFDKTLKPKKPTMQNLDREIIVDFIRKQIKEAQEQVLREVCKLKPNYWEDEDHEVGGYISRKDIHTIAHSHGLSLTKDV